MQPLLLAEEYDETPQPAAPGPQNVPREIEDEPPEPATVEELESHISLLRRAAGLDAQRSPEQMDLGVRHAVNEDELVNLSNRRTTPRVGVNEGFEGSPYDEDLPSPGL